MGEAHQVILIDGLEGGFLRRAGHSNPKDGVQHFVEVVDNLDDLVHAQGNVELAALPLGAFCGIVDGSVLIDGSGLWGIVAWAFLAGNGTATAAGNRDVCLCGGFFVV